MLACKITGITLPANVLVNFILIKRDAMRKTGALLLFCFIASVLHAQTDTTRLENQVKQYYFVLLVKGKNRGQDSITAAKIQDGHLANIRRLYNAGKLKVAGPFGEDSDWRGIFIFDCATRDELDALLKTDPAIAAGRLAYEVHSWYTVPTGSFKPGKPEPLQ